MASGLSVEKDLRDFWRDLNCRVQYSEDADLYGKTDAVILGIGQKLAKPIIVQITTNIDQPAKQKGFETYFLGQKDKFAVYLEIDSLAFERVRLNLREGCGRVYEIAKKTVEIFLKIDKISRELKSHLICLRVDKNLKCKCFDLSIRWRLVCSWRARQLSSAQRRRGVITRFWNGSYGIIKSSVGGREESRRVHISSIRDSNLRAQLVGGRPGRGRWPALPPLQGRVSIPVTFLPAEADPGPPDIGPTEYEYLTALAVQSI